MCLSPPPQGGQPDCSPRLAGPLKKGGHLCCQLQASRLSLRLPARTRPTASPKTVLSHLHTLACLASSTRSPSRLLAACSSSQVDKDHLLPEAPLASLVLWAEHSYRGPGGCHHRAVVLVSEPALPAQSYWRRSSSRQPVPPPCVLAGPAPSPSVGAQPRLLRREVGPGGSVGVGELAGCSGL